MSPALRLCALGGLAEVGMNCLALEAAGRLVVVDAGVTFPDRELGIDVIHPDFSFVTDRAQDLEAVVLTHGHEDHIGAVPYLLREIGRDVPVYGPPYALGLVEERLREAELGRPVRLIETQPRKPLVLGPLEITPYRVTHSIPDATGLVVQSGELTLVHTGDFKIEREPLDGQLFDEAFLAGVAASGVRALLSDSTNAEVEGEAGGEAGVAQALERHVAAAKQRLVISTFGSNVYRLSSILKSAAAHDRKVLLLGRSLLTHARVAEQLGRLPPLAPLLASEQEAQKLPRHRLLVVATGSQGEPLAALRRLAAGTHHLLTLEPEDELVLSSRVIPGRERQVAMLIDALVRRGVRVHTRREDPALHVSGHAHRGEQRRMLEIVRPQTFVPVHGTYLQRLRHAELARDAGVKETLILDNGDVLELDTASARVVERVQSGRVHIQEGEPVSDRVLHHRMHMSEGGVVLVLIELGPGRSVSRPPRVVCRGVAEDDELEELQLPAEAERAALRALRMLERDAGDDALLTTAERAVRRTFRDALGFRPLVHAVIQRTAG